jgi:hypothetical protein
MITAIMQPTYLSWPGYFDLIDQCDVFVFLDTVQFEKQSWQQRNRIKTQTGPLWLTVPASRCLPQRIADVRIDESSHWRRKHWLSIATSYARAPYWPEYREPLEAIYMKKWIYLADLNIALTSLMARSLGLQARFLRTSEMLPIDQGKSARLVEICARLTADVYLSPRGSLAYMESELPFSERGIRLAFQQFEPPVYPQQFSGFIPYLSTLDLLLNVGPEALGVLRSGRRPWLTISELAAGPPERPTRRETSLSLPA